MITLSTSLFNYFFAFLGDRELLIVLLWTARTVEVLDCMPELTGRAFTAAMEIYGMFGVVDDAGRGGGVSGAANTTPYSETSLLDGGWDFSSSSLLFSVT